MLFNFCNLRTENLNLYTFIYLFYPFLLFSFHEQVPWACSKFMFTPFYALGSFKAGLVSLGSQLDRSICDSHHGMTIPHGSRVTTWPWHTCRPVPGPWATSAELPGGPLVQAFGRGDLDRSASFHGESQLFLGLERQKMLRTDKITTMYGRGNSKTDHFWLASSASSSGECDSELVWFAILAFCLFDLDLGQTAFEVVYQKFNSSKQLADVWMDFLVATWSTCGCGTV